MWFQGFFIEFMGRKNVSSDPFGCQLAVPALNNLNYFFMPAHDSFLSGFVYIDRLFR